MKKRLTAIFLALLLVSALAAPARAQAPEAAGQAGVLTLTDAEAKVFERLKAGAAQVADGTRSTTTFEISTSGMGITTKGNELKGLDVSTILHVMLAECPYELYWFDKARGYTSSCQYNSDSGTVVSLTIQFAVCQDYALVTPDGKSYYQYQADTQKTSAAAAAVQNAQKVVDDNSGLSDYEKLLAYRDYICGQTTYNNAAAANPHYPYGNPWQMISVFDNDPGTNVVCEGYAKAFQYLCDLTDFSGAVECYIVTGRTSGSHMWNVVRINGKSYLVDVTNSDEGNLGAFGGLFLAGASNATENGYTINIPRQDLGGGHYVPATSITYTYDGETKMLYGKDILTIAASEYDPAADSAPQAPAFTDVSAGAYYADAVAWAVEGKITTGTTTTTFAPGKDCTQAQILTFLYRAAGEAPPSVKAPVPVDAAYADAVGWAYGEGMIDESFAPGAPCTRADAVRYIWLAFGRHSGGSSSFTDVPEDADYADAVGWAVGLGITNGYANGDGTYAFHPDTVCSRGIIVTLLHRAYVEDARLDVN